MVYSFSSLLFGFFCGYLVLFFFSFLDFYISGEMGASFFFLVSLILALGRHAASHPRLGCICYKTGDEACRYNKALKYIDSRLNRRSGW